MGAQAVLGSNDCKPKNGDNSQCQSDELGDKGELQNAEQPIGGLNNLGRSWLVEIHSAEAELHHQVLDLVDDGSGKQEPRTDSGTTADRSIGVSKEGQDPTNEQCVAGDEDQDVGPRCQP